MLLPIAPVYSTIQLCGHALRAGALELVFIISCNGRAPFSHAKSIVTMQAFLRRNPHPACCWSQYIESKDTNPIMKLTNIFNEDKKISAFSFHLIFFFHLSICYMLLVRDDSHKITIFAHVLHHHCETTHSAGTNHSYIASVIFNWSFLKLVSDLRGSISPRHTRFYSWKTLVKTLLHQTYILQFS